jgi:excisionase family DNA binding protein
MFNKQATVTVQQAARESDCTYTYLYTILRSGKLLAHKDPAGTGRWLIRRSDFEAWNRQRVRRAPKSGRSVASAIVGAHT